MAFTFQAASEAQAQVKTGGASLTVAPAATIAAGRVAVVFVGYENISTTAGSSSDLSISDAKSNTWEKLAEATSTAGVAGDGVTGAIWFSNITSALGVSDDITVTSTGAVTPKSLSVAEFSVGAGNTATSAVTAATKIVPTGGGTQTTSLAGLSSGTEYLFLGNHAIENTNLTAVGTQDANFTSLTQIGTTGGGSASNATHRGAYRITSGVTSVDWTTTSAAGNDTVYILGALSEVSSGNATVTPSAFTPTLTNSTPGSGTALTELVPDGDGTAANILYSTGTTAYTLIDEDPDSAAADYIYNTTTDGSVFVTLSATDTDFSAVRYLQVQHRFEPTGFGSDSCAAYAQVFANDETTAYTDEALLGDNTTLNVGDQPKFATLTVNATGLAANKAAWDAARLRIRFDYTA